MLAGIFVPPGIFVLAGIYVPAAIFVLAGIFLPAAIFVITGIFVPVCLFCCFTSHNKPMTMVMARRTARVTTPLLGKLENAVNQYFVMGAQWLSGRVLDSRPRASPALLRCVLEQDALILA